MGLDGDVSLEYSVLKVIVLHKEGIALISILVDDPIVGWLLGDGQDGRVRPQQITVLTDDDVVDLVQPQIVHDGQGVDSLESDGSLWLGVVGIDQSVGVRPHILYIDQLDDVKANHLISESIEHHWLFLELHSHQSKLVEFGLSYLPQKVSQLLYLRIILIISDDVVSIAGGAVLHRCRCSGRGGCLRLLLVVDVVG